MVEVHENQSMTMPLLHFLWRWKVSTTSTLHRRFAPLCSGKGFYVRLLRLEKRGLINSRVHETRVDTFWVLGKKGFAVLKNEIPPRVEEGYLSENLRHDLLVTAVHLGEGLFGKIQGLEWFTEQELRRIDPDYYPPWVPECIGHRPDGFWYVSNNAGHSLIALEVELSPKPDREYESIMRFYSDMQKIDEVLWVVSSPRLSKKIQSEASKTDDHSLKHNILPLESFYTAAHN